MAKGKARTDQDHSSEPSVRKSPSEARQGERGPSMLLVLGFGIVALVIAYLIVGWLNSNGDMVSLSVIDDQAQQGDRVPSANEQRPDQSGTPDDAQKSDAVDSRVPGANTQ